MAESRIVPEGVPASVPYADAYVIRVIADMLNIYFVRVPPAFTDAQQEALRGAEVRLPAVSSVTLPMELAGKLADSIRELAAQKKK